MAGGVHGVVSVCLYVFDERNPKGNFLRFLLRVPSMSKQLTSETPLPLSRLAEGSRRPPPRAQQQCLHSCYA